MERLRRSGLLKLAGWARVFGLNDWSLALYEQLQAEFPEDPRVLSAIAFAYDQQGRRREALARFERVAVLTPDAVEAHFNCGYLLQALNNHEAAVEAFNRALAINPDHDRALYGLALSLISLKRLDEAVVPLEKNTRLQPMSPYGWYQLGRVQHDRGKVEKTAAIVAHLATFEPNVAAQLARETGVRLPS